MQGPVWPGEIPVTALYIHIPFCASRCHYCDFTTYVAPQEAIDAYVDALLRELAMLAPLVREPLQTVFFGGGTPSLLSGAQMQRIMAAVRSCFGLRPDAEVTAEANPGTLDDRRLAAYREAGINRLSFGAQTFNPRLLAAMGRTHDAGAVREAVRGAQAAGFTRVNVDLMFGLPDQTLADVADALRETIALGVEHISAYWLKVEPGTPWHEWLAEGRIQLPGEDLEADMYDLVRDTLTRAGYVHYEVSNFARPGGEARHNLVYWRNEPYLAAGVSAHGYVAGWRYENVRPLRAYMERVRAGMRPLAWTHPVGPDEMMEDTMILGLRLREGVSRARFRERHGIDMLDRYGPVIADLAARGLVAWTGDRLHLTDRAWPVANEVFAAFLDRH
ncbi:coproporphyrinogen III oxidase [Alicyclobacillus cellulosilyticus]|uniref:Heme chaperone HemW n=1 Tax=Alicyclobacillus cellulosilyticus TaxID=1003997 RepID=A0A917NL42_9BACL|nr:radical SAM family heme chaperone HemW [Alicyclobacillus cellulosilyticus]GGJ09376.1 coproporphyrinogen III oxidase [Alicyclobacillus cellulosilyticus]